MPLTPSAVLEQEAESLESILAAPSTRPSRRKVRRVSIIMPAYNEGASIASVVRSLRSLPDLREIIVVDDGSSDATAARAEAAGARVIRHRYNRGYGASLKTGVRAARGYYVLFVDADGQHTPDDVRKVIAKLGQADMVVGRRRGTEGSPWYRRPGKIIVGRLVNHLARIRIPDINSGLRGGRRSLMRSILPLMPNGFSFTTTSTLALLNEGFDIHYEPINVQRRVGKSSVSMLRDGARTMLLIVRLISVFAPLRVFTPFAGLCMLGGFASLCNDIFINDNIADTTLLLLIVGVMVFFYGVLADQVAAIRRETIRGEAPTSRERAPAVRRRRRLRDEEEATHA